MSILIQEIQKSQLKEITHFKVGDDIEIITKIDESRTQAFKGTVIARKNKGLASSVTLRKTTQGVAVEKVFMLHSPLISITRLKKGRVRRAKLYYLRSLSGRAARIKEDVRKSRN